MANPLASDPTRMTTLRNAFIADMNRRFKALQKSVTFAVGTQDALGLNDEPLEINQAPGRKAWAFMTDSQKLDAFNLWFKGEIEQEILTVEGAFGEPWTNQYVGSAYRKGSIRAYTDTKKETNASSLDFYNGSKEQFLESAFNQPERVEKLRFLYTRTFEELKGISNAMSQQVSRTLAQGIANGLGAEEVARRLDNTISGINRTRARVLARTELVAAHSEGQLDSFEDLGITHVGVMVEWSTAGDDKVCPLCRPLEGVVLTIREARGMIPRHAQCRCAWKPAFVGEDQRGQKTGQKAQTAISKSMLAERSDTKTVTQAKRKSVWQGKEVTVNPVSEASKRLAEVLGNSKCTCPHDD